MADVVRRLTDIFGEPPVDLAAVYAAHPVLKLVEDKVEHRLGKRSAVVSLLPLGAIGAEIGVFTGVFSEYLMRTTRPKRFFLVDAWEKLHGPIFANFGDYGGADALTTEAAKNAAKARALQFPGASVVCEFGAAWLNSLEPGALDWIYLDASHAYAPTMDELAAAARVLKPNGIIAGDDAWKQRQGPHYGVFRAIRDFCRANPWEIIYMDRFAQWAIRATAD